MFKKIFCRHNHGLKTLYTFKDEGWNKTVYVRSCNRCERRWFFHKENSTYFVTYAYKISLLNGITED